MTLMLVAVSNWCVSLLVFDTWYPNLDLVDGQADPKIQTWSNWLGSVRTEGPHFRATGRKKYTRAYHPDPWELWSPVVCPFSKP